MSLLRRVTSLPSQRLAAGSLARALLAAAAFACGAPASAGPDAPPAAAVPAPASTPSPAAPATPNPGPTPADSSAGQSPAAPATRADAYALFRRQFDAKDFAAAAATAQQVAQLTEKDAGATGEDLQVALMNLGLSQFLSGDYVGAEASYLRVIELVQASGKRHLERLTRANAGLAATYYAGKRYDLAVQRFETAVSLSRRSEGLLSEAQLPLLEKFTDALTELGRYPDALQVQKYALRVAERKYGERDPRVAPTLEKMARWFSRVGAYDAARTTLHRAIGIVEDVEGPNSVNLVGPLTALADCARRQLLDPSQAKLASADSAGASLYRDPTSPPPFSPTATAAEGQRALDRAVAIASDRADPSPTQVADVRTQYGDWFQTRSQPERALPQYQQAWQAASRVPYEGKTLADALFGKPVLLHYVRPEGWDRYSGRPAAEIQLKVVLLDLTVAADGRTRDVKVLDDSGDARRAEQATEAAATASYRPRFEKGQPVDTPNVQFTQVFQVLAPKAAPADAPVAGGKS